MSDIRSLFLAAARAARDLVADPAVGAAWHEPSALLEFRVSGLAGHLTGRTTEAVLQYLDAPAPAEADEDAAAYYLRHITYDPRDEGNAAVRERGEQYAADGQQALVDHATRTLDELERRLAAEPADRKVEVFGGSRMLLDEYLVTRLAELLIHTDDLAVSVGLPTPVPDPDAAAAVIGCCVAMGRRRHGDVAVLRALSRAERDDVAALRVL